MRVALASFASLHVIDAREPPAPLPVGDPGLYTQCCPRDHPDGKEAAMSVVGFLLFPGRMGGGREPCGAPGPSFDAARLFHGHP